MGVLGRRRERKGPDLRARIFETDPRELGCGPDGARQVWGVVVDLALEDGAATVVSLVDGTTSLYTSTGGGLIGGGTIEPIGLASEALVYAAERDVDHIPPVAGAFIQGCGVIRAAGSTLSA